MQNINKRRAFTLIELLVVVAIIAMLTALLSVAQQKVKIVSKNLRQKAAFHGGEISLELFNNDFGEYPDSSWVEDGGTYVTGAQRVAEALFGRDDRGFHPKTKWHPAKDIAAAAPYPGADLYTLSTIKDRKIPYFERKHSNFYSIYDLWGPEASAGGGTFPIYNAGSSTTATYTERSPVFTDVFTRNRITLNGDNIKVGMPILYFRADPTKRFRMDTSNNEVNPATYEEYKDWIYNFSDNLSLLELPWLRELGQAGNPAGMDIHYKDPEDPTKANAQYFYELITQRKDDNFFRPYNKNKFLLISAGWDGIFGTKDDLTNFDD
jgi:prepilin-type N-terminal cleavage/methylation domain-containing protein